MHKSTDPAVTTLSLQGNFIGVQDKAIAGNAPGFMRDDTSQCSQAEAAQYWLL